jgi:hypothetical protein
MTDETRTKVRGAVQRFADDIIELVIADAAPDLGVSPTNLVEDLNYVVQILDGLDVPTDISDFDVETDVDVDVQSSHASYDGCGGVDVEMSVSVDANITDLNSSCDDLSEIADEIETARNAISGIVASLPDPEYGTD